MSFARLLAVSVLIAALLIIPVTAAWSPPTDRSLVGVEWNASDPSPALRWIDVNGNTIVPPDFNDHVVWGNVRKVLLDGNNVVIRDTNPRGDALDLTGASGKVMTEIPAFYVMSANASTDQFRYYRWFISPDPAAGFELHPAFVQRGGTARDYIYLGSYEATLRVLGDGTLALDSRSGEQPWTGYEGSQPRDGLFKIGFTGGSSQPAVGATIAGGTSGSSGQLVDLHVSSGSWGGGNAAGVFYLKQTTGSFTNGEDLRVSGSAIAAAATATGNAGVVANINTFEAAGEALGSGYGAMNVWTYSAVRMLHLVEYANWGSQETVGLGIVSKASGTGFAGEVTGFNSVDTNVNEYGTGTGTGSAGYTPASYRTMTDLWGNSWEWVTGYTSVNTEYRITKRDGTGSLSTHPLAANSYESSTATPRTYDVTTAPDGYWTSIEYENILQYQFIPNEVGGSYLTYGTDYVYSHRSGTRVLLAGGTWPAGRAAGLGSLAADHAASASARSSGARLEFVGPTTLAGGAPGAQYALNATSGNAPLAVAFSDESTGTPGWWRWDFGDGNTSTDQNPTHVYSTPGTYTVNLTAWTIYGEDTVTKTIEVLKPPVANMTYNVTAGNAPLSVQFTDTSGGNVTAWSWSFGDGNTSSAQSPIYTYTAPGTYTVTLNASNAHGYSTANVTITVLLPPSAGFAANVTAGNAPLSVQFTDTSGGNVTAWSWSFGDGNTSSAQSPIYTYTAPGTYTVTLNASNAYSSDLETKTGYVTVHTAPAAAFSANVTEGNAPLVIQFTDASGGNVTAWSWDFGDGNGSVVQNPVHTYAAPGTYTVTLNASNIYGYDLAIKTDYITVLPPPAAGFSANVTEGNAPLSVQFTDTSGGNVTAWSWDFGDGNGSAVQSPVHTYSAPGLYTVTLNASNIYGYDLATRTDYITVLPPPVAGFSANVTVVPVGGTVQFTDASGGNVTVWSWNFGDGNTSTAKNPTHAYSAPGLYTVTLNASNAYGYNLVTKPDLIDVGTPPSAGFAANVTAGNAPLAIQFTDASGGNATAWFWDFGDNINSTEQHPEHTYAAVGTYTVTLNASNSYGFSVKTEANYITVLEPPVVGFSANVTEGNAPLVIQFTDASGGNATAWSWDFGDGNVSALQSPVHTYVAPGTYTVTLNASNIYGYDLATRTDYITVLPPPVASFSANVTEGNAPLAIQFTDTSGGNVTAWSWDFGDGNGSVVQNPVHTYAAPGTYTVTLNASNIYGYDLAIKTDYITVLPPPAAGFSANVTEGNAPLSVQFTDTSGGNVTAWSWDFGDGNGSAVQSPVHTYAAPGLYTVTLNASNIYGYDLATRTDYITVLPPPVAGFSANVTEGNAPLVIQFTDTPGGNVTAWSWNFGDGGTSTAKNPTHAYSAPGLYTVTLNASNIYGYDLATRTDYITVLPPPAAGFTANITVVPVGGTVQFTDTSGGNVTAWSWNFGDGGTSTAKNPTHAYSAPGLYTVTLNASNAYGYNTSTRTGYIDVGYPPVADFSPSATIGLAPGTITFTDLSTNTPTAWSWTFGDGGYSSYKTPTHTYGFAGTYTVTLTATNAYGSDTETKPALITIYNPLVPSFIAAPTSGYIPLSVQFADTTTGSPTAWSWDFGDGNVSALQNPTHTYTEIGRYTVTLTVSHAADEKSVTKTDHIVADHQFTAAFTQNVSYGMVPFAVQFTDLTAGSPAGYLWAFGDGGTSTAKNPVHTYTVPGFYTVSLTVYGINTQHTVTRDSAVHAGILPTVFFTGTPTTGLAPLSVQFTSVSQDTTSYLWAFGDGGTSTAKNPTHTYTVPGTYTVTLTGTNLYGSTVSTQTGYITVTQVPPVAAFTASPLSGHAPIPIQFTDLSTNTPTSWLWTFGDGGTSTDRNPRHVYRVAGTYPVTLTVNNNGGSDTLTKTEYVTIYPAGDPGYTSRYPRSDLVTTLDATGLGTQTATLHAELTGTAAATEVWFEYGTKSNSYGYRTDAVTAEGGSLINTEIRKFPLIAGQTYYFRAACADGYGAERTFTLPAVTPRPPTTYGAAAYEFIDSYKDGDTMVETMAETTWSPYVTSLGALFFGLVIGGIFLNLAMKGHSIAIPTLLVMIIGVSLWSFVPPEFVIIAQAFLIVGLGGLVYYIYTKRKM